MSDDPSEKTTYCSPRYQPEDVVSRYLGYVGTPDDRRPYKVFEVNASNGTIREYLTDGSVFSEEIRTKARDLARDRMFPSSVKLPH